MLRVPERVNTRVLTPVPVRVSPLPLARAGVVSHLQVMLTLRLLACAVALTAPWLPTRAAGQAAGPPMSPAEREAYEMGQQMAFPCNPQRHRNTPESESMIRREKGPLPGTAAFLPTAEGTFLVLEGYDENQAGHCLVLAWFGDELEPGRYPVRRLSMAAMEEELDSGEHSFFTFSAVRSPDESATFVADSGSLEIDSMDQGMVRGTFELSGFTINSRTREDDIALEGSFSALEQGG